MTKNRLGIDDKYLKGLIFATIGLAYLYLIYSYVRLDTLGVYDAAGQLAAVDHAKGFWPNWQGWSSRDLLGWPQGLIYPPGVHWVMAGLALIIGSVAAVKLVVVVALAALPIAMWWYLKQIKIAVNWRGPLVVLLTIILLISPDYMGSSVSSLFYLGLIPNFVVLPLLFVFLGQVTRLSKQSNWKHLALAGLVLGLLVWSHLVAAIVAVMYVIVTMLIAGIQRKWRLVRSFLIIGLVSIVVSLPLLIKMIPLIKGQITSAGGMPSLLLLDIFVLIVSLILSVVLWKKHVRLGLTPVLMAIVFSAIGVADSLLVKVFGTSFLLEWLHAYRLQPFAYLFATVSVVQVISKIAVNHEFKYIHWVNLLSVPVVIVALIANNPVNFDYAQITLGNVDSIKGRFLEDFRRLESYSAPYTFQTKLLAANDSTSWAYGLFIESSPNSSFVKSLSKSLRPTAYASDPVSDSLDSVVLPQTRVQSMLDLFAIDNIISLDNNSDNNIGTWTVGQKNQYYHAQKLTTKQLAQVPTVPLRPVSTNWNGTVDKWWRETGDMVDLPYDASSGLIESKYNTNTEVTVDKWTDNNIDLNIHSDSPVPVLIKTTYSPGWHAISSNGNDIKIWRCAPQLMLIQANGVVHIQYK